VVVAGKSPSAINKSTKKRKKKKRKATGQGEGGVGGGGNTSGRGPAVDTASHLTAGVSGSSVPGLAVPMAQTEHEMELSAVANAGTWASMKVRLCVCDHVHAILHPSARLRSSMFVW
jgi:hypothetical protein